MAASINDKIIQAQNGGAPQPTTVSSARSIGGTSLGCVALTNWPTATAVHLITYKKKTDGTMDRSTLCLWKGIVSGTTIGTLTLKGGTDAGNSVGDFVEAAPTSAQWQDLYNGLTQTLNVDGTLKDGIVTTAKIADGAVTTSTLAAGAVPIKIGVISSSVFGTTGNKTVTGVGFKPQLIKTFPLITGTGAAQYANGVATASSQYISAFTIVGASATYNRINSSSGFIGFAASSTGWALFASLVSMDADGFTINVTTAANDFSYVYEAYA